MALICQTGNRLELLVERLATSLAQEPPAPLAREIIVVPSQGLRRWLTLQLADKLQIAAALHLPFPREFVREIASQILEGRPLPDPRLDPSDDFDRATLTWRVFDLLRQASPAGSSRGLPPALRVPAAYLAQDPDQRKRFQLASRTAALLDDYQLYRPELLTSWRDGTTVFDGAGSDDAWHEHVLWQAWLWQGLIEGSPHTSLDRRLQLVVDRLRHGPVSPASLPSRLTFFACSHLPPALVELLGALGRHLDVTLYLPSPTWHFWGDLVSDRERLRLTRRASSRRNSVELEHRQRGHALLTSLGQQGRELFNALLALDDTLGDEELLWNDDDFADPVRSALLDPTPGDPSVLQILQHDILHLIDRDPDGETPPAIWPAGDISVRVHLCRSPRRELEILREELLDAFSTLPTLRPSDVVVMVPEIATYAPLIEAVFGVDQPVAFEAGGEDEPGSGTVRLPYTVADRSLDAGGAAQRSCAAALLAVLDLVGERLTLGEIFGLLEFSTLRRAADLEESELDTVRHWLETVKVRWAIDGEQRQQDFGLPAFDANSWRQGLDRLILGYALGSLDHAVGGLAPQAGATAGDPDLLGRFTAFLDRLFDVLRGLRHSRPPGAWADQLEQMLDLVADRESPDESLQRIGRVLDELRARQAAADITEPESLSLAVLRELLGDRLTEEGFGGFLTGAITFCSLRPLRSVPFRVIAVAGLDDTSFPRRPVQSAFDLMAARRRAGDRSTRLDDRQLFLEILLAARDRLLLSYVGADQRDTSEYPPSVVLAELLDQIDHTFVLPDGRPAREILVQRQPLQGWSPQLFQPDHPRSSHLTDLEAARARTQPVDLPAFFAPVWTEPVSRDASTPTVPTAHFELRDLQLALRDSARYFCNKVLLFSLPAAEREAKSETEFFQLAQLDAFEARRELLEARLRPPPVSRLHPTPPGAPSAWEDVGFFHARGQLPPGELGAATWRALRRRVETLWWRLPPELREPAPTSTRAITVLVPGWQLDGTLTLRGNPEKPIFLYCRPGQLRPRDLMDAWLDLLAWLCRSADDASRHGVAPRVFLFGEDRGVELKPPAQPYDRLQEIVELATVLQQKPVPFFERASFAYAETLHQQQDPRLKSAGPEAALQAAQKAFAGEAHAPYGDAASPYCQLVWRGRELWAPGSEELAAFDRWSRRLVLPLLAARRELVA